MAACEKCWNDAYVQSLMNGRPQAEIYRELLEERRDNPCPPEVQHEHPGVQQSPGDPQ